jgi:hypothetical protein
LDAHEELEHLEQESHVIWTHLEARLEPPGEAQILEHRVPELNVLIDAHEILTQARAFS